MSLSEMLDQYHDNDRTLTQKLESTTKKKLINAREGVRQRNVCKGAYSETFKSYICI